eukprot:GFKZ01000861.1.p1 GENE.GFKZ01000861.1~~GFKZ01000861.1.p1  ORF type:complete len:647 (-),score=80.97 GFKZ01000861.1:89-1804(-)
MKLFKPCPPLHTHTTPSPPPSSPADHQPRVPLPPDFAFVSPKPVSIPLGTQLAVCGRRRASCAMSTGINHLAAGLKTVPALPPTMLPVDGRLPWFLESSTLYRQGPGRYEVKHTDNRTSHIRHWFDGYALVHAFSIDAESNSVTYRSNFVTPGAVRAAVSVPRAKHHPFLFSRSDPCYSVLGRLFQVFCRIPMDPVTGLPAANVNVTLQSVPGKGAVVARTDFNVNGVVNEESLEVERFFKFGTRGGEGKAEREGEMCAAHGQVDEERGEFWNYRYSLGSGQVTYSVFRIGPGGNEEVMGVVKDVPAYIHSFAMTEHYVVLCVWPLLVGGLKLLWSRSFMDSMRFDKERMARFHVFARDGRGLVATYEADAFFCFHTVNAFEKDDAVHVDLCRYKNADVLDDFMLDKMRSKERFEATTLTRFSLGKLQEAIMDGPQRVKEAKERVLSAEGLELPCVNGKVQCKEYRFVYGVTDWDGRSFGAVAKVNVEDGSRKLWWMRGGVVGEPIFVADPHGSGEDDGVLLVVVMLAGGEKSCLVVVDAQTMEEVARATVPQVVPLGFHGKFVRSDEEQM